MHIPKRAILYDFHTMPGCPDVGKNFDCDAVAEQLARCEVDFTVFPARCNMGMAYYDTHEGIRHPALQYDLFGSYLKAMHRKNIAVSAYFNVGISHEEGLRHRDWTVVTPDGYAYKPPRMDHFFRNMCYNSGYADHLIAMIKEVLANYDVDGLFFDCFTPHPCIGVECLNERKELNMDEATHARFSQHRLMQRITDAVRESGRDLLLYFNCVPFHEQQNCATYIEYECLPTGGWGYDALPTGARHVRTFGLPVLNMSGRFHESWGDFGGIRSRESLFYDVITGLANGLPPNIGDHFHPRGDMNHAVYDLIAGIFQEVKKLDEWTDHARAVTEVALVMPPDAPDNTLEAVPSIRANQGFSRMLRELHMQFDVILPHQDFSPYRLLVLPDQIIFDEKLAEKVRAFLARGGKIISSYHSGMTPELDRFALNEEWNCQVQGESAHDPAYFRLHNLPLPNFPDMPVALYDRGISIKCGEKAVSGAKIIAPYYNRQFDGEHAYLYLPPDSPDGTDELVMSPSVTHFAHPIGFSYYKHAQLPVRKLLKYVLQQYLPKPLLQIDNLPSFCGATVTGQPGRRMVWLTAYLPERRGEKIDMIEEGMLLDATEVRLRLDHPNVTAVYLAPRRQKLDFRLENGYCIIKVPPFKGYNVIVVEETSQMERRD